MEFFAQCHVDCSSEILQQHLSISQLLNVCESVTEILQDTGSQGKVYCIWGEFAVNRELINGGVRFSLPTCPNNLAWSVTFDEHDPEAKIIIHLTVSKQQLDNDFKESIDVFVDDLQQGIGQYFLQIKEGVV